MSDRLFTLKQVQEHFKGWDLPPNLGRWCEPEPSEEMVWSAVLSLLNEPWATRGWLDDLLVDALGFVESGAWFDLVCGGGGPEAVLRALDVLLDTHGVEALFDAGEDGVRTAMYSPNDEHVASYLNSGDTYSSTILWDVGAEEFVLTSWGDWLAEYEEDREEEQEVTNEKIKEDEEEEYNDTHLPEAVADCLLQPLGVDESWSGALCDAVTIVEREVANNKVFKPGADEIETDLLGTLANTEPDSEFEPDSELVSFWLDLWKVLLRRELDEIRSMANDLSRSGKSPLRWLAEEIKPDLCQATGRPVLATSEIVDALKEALS